jgi:peroxiredoxin
LGLHHQKLREHNVEVLVIGGGGQARAQAMVSKFRLPFPVLADPDREVYRQYYLSKKLVMMQQSGTMLIDKQGVIRYIKRFTNPQAWMGSREIAHLLEAAAALDPP